MATNGGTRACVSATPNYSNRDAGKSDQSINSSNLDAEECGERLNSRRAGLLHAVAAGCASSLANIVAAWGVGGWNGGHGGDCDESEEGSENFEQHDGEVSVLREKIFG